MSHYVTIASNTQVRRIHALVCATNACVLSFFIQVGQVRRAMSTTAQASTIAMVTVSVLALTRVSVQRAGVDRAASLRHAGMTSSFKIFIQPFACLLEIFCFSYHFKQTFVHSMSS